MMLIIHVSLIISVVYNCTFLCAITLVLAPVTESYACRDAKQLCRWHT